MDSDNGIIEKHSDINNFDQIKDAESEEESSHCSEESEDVKETSEIIKLDQIGRSIDS